MRTFIILAIMFFGLSVSAHEGHGEMPTEASKYGGIVGNVVSQAKMQKKDKNNPPLMKAEIVRSDDGTVRLYVFDLKMQPLAGDGLSQTALGEVENVKARTKEKFSLELQGNHYIGKMLKQKKKPFNIYVTFSKGADKFFVGFDNLD